MVKTYTVDPIPVDKLQKHLVPLARTYLKCVEYDSTKFPIKFRIVDESQLDHVYNSGYDISIIGMSEITIENASNVKNVILAWNGNSFHRIDNVDGRNTLTFDFPGNGDILLADPTGTFYSTVYLEINHDEQVNDECNPIITYIPWVAKTRDLMVTRFTYTSKINDKYFYYGGGQAGLTDTPPKQELTAGAALDHSIDTTKKILPLRSHKVWDIINAIPLEYYVSGKRPEYVIHTYPGSVDLFIWEKYLDECIKLCKSIDENCSLGMPLNHKYYTEEQEKLYDELAQQNTDELYEKYLYILGDN